MKNPRFQSFQSYLSGVKIRESQPELGLGSPEGLMGFAILSLISIAVMDFANKEEGIAFLKSHDAAALIQKYGKMIRSLPSDADLGIFVVIGVAHTSSMLDLHECAEYLVGRVQDPIGRHFWDEYARAMLCLVEKRPYEPKLGTLKGSQKYWAAYLPFISDITNGRDTSGSIESLRQSFLKRQTDKRITDDGGVIVEGSTKQPTHWDFRAEALKAYAAYKYGLTFPA